MMINIRKWLYSKYVVIKGCHINNRAVMTLIKVDYNYKGVFIRDLITGKRFSPSDVYCKIYTFRKLMYWGRMLSPKATGPYLYWRVLVEVKSKKWKIIKKE